MSFRRDGVAVGFTDRWNLRTTMVFEGVYHPNLRMSLAEKRHVVEEPTALCVWMYDRRRRALIGETYGVPASIAFEEHDEGAVDAGPYVGRPALYVLSTTILPRFQGRGFGKIIKAYHLGRAAQAGYRVVIGHAREGASCALNVAFGAVLGRRHPDWYGTGEPYRFYVLPLAGSGRSREPGQGEGEGEGDGRESRR
jgi:GNAT superfamily N-acetyltransferase